MALLSQVSTSYPRVPRNSFARTRACFLIIQLSGWFYYTTDRTVEQVFFLFLCNSSPICRGSLAILCQKSLSDDSISVHLEYHNYSFSLSHANTSSFLANHLALYNYSFFTNNARIAFNTARIITPTSAKIASHILAIPTAPRIRQISFTLMATEIF